MTMNDYFAEYSESHQNKINQVIHKICVPLIFFSILGVLDCIPFYFSPAIFLIGFSLIFYLKNKMSKKLFILILIQIAFTLFIQSRLLMPFKLQMNLAIFIIAWIGQFIGHLIEGKRPSFFKDFLFLLIGPAWVTNFFIKD